jgi:putative tryptophan/tyrosine transport system substrate-binding protein
LITLLAATSVAWPLVARAQKPAKIPHVVVISPGPLPDRYRELFRDLGYIEGRNIRLEFRDAEGYADRLSMLAEQLVQEGDVDVIATVSLPAAIAAHKATGTIPVVAFVAGDPVTSGLARSLAHPGGNVTGVAVFAEETNVKRVEMVREIAPGAVRLAMIATQIGLTQQSLASTREAAQKLGFALEVIRVDDPSNIAKILTPERLAGFDAFVVPPDAVLNLHEAEVVKSIGLTSKPAIYPSSDWVENGGLMSFGPDFLEASRHWVSQLDRVLKGESPSDLPFDRPTKFYLSINLRTARAMGFKLPSALLARADGVIE